jgi:hypothetical protein
VTVVRLDARRVLRQRARRAKLDRSGTDPIDVTRALAALHATDPATLHLSVWARMPAKPIRSVAEALRSAFESERSLVRILGMRRTLHVVPRELVPAVSALAKARLAGPQRKLARELLVQAGLATEATAETTFELVSRDIQAALAGGDATIEDLAGLVPAMAARVRFGEGKAYASEAPIGRNLVEALGASGRTIRARALGGWRTTKTTWAALDRWLPEAAAAHPAEAFPEIVAAWLRAFGPATLDDAAWWAGLPKRDVQAAVTALGPRVVQVEVQGWKGPRVAWAEDLDGPAEPVGVALLPALDPSVMAVTDRTPFLDPAWAGPLFDRSGNVAPTIWLDGRVIGGWACRKDGSVAFRILDDAARGADDEIRAAARVLEEALDGEAVQPRFPTPLSKELAAS